MKNNNEYSFEEGLADGLYIDLSDSAPYKMIHDAGMHLQAFITFGLFDSSINADSNELIDERLASLLTDTFLEIKNSEEPCLRIISMIEDNEINFDAQIQISNQYGKVLVLSLPNELN